ncbi:MAG: ExbD/TolR family protein [Deltaproteobacteria bacterium]|nr:ExbD/TolR family protein [Deltaproteobacteria bacterium]
MLETGKNKKLLSQINVTPFVDVCLVLLVIFMVTAPMMQTGVDVKLPQVEAGEVSADEEPLVVVVTSARRVFIGSRAIAVKEIKTELGARQSKGRMVLLKADETVPYGVVMAALSEIKKAGIEKVGMMTEPLDEKGR